MNRVPWLRTSGDRPVVEITDAARGVILEEACKMPFLESGGALGSTELLPSPLRVDIARGPTKSVARRRDSVTLHRRELEDSCGEYALAGDWHSHPRGGARFSPQDLKAWSWMRSTCRRPPRGYVALIVAADANEPDPVRG